MSEKDVTVKIPKGMADFILKQEWLRYYRDLDDFVVSGVRREMEAWLLTKAK